MKVRELHRVVVTGPTGAVGTALCRRLLHSGCEVYAVCRPGSSRITQVPEGDRIHVVLCDQSEIAELSTMIDAPCDAFYHLAWSKTTGAGRNDMLSQVENIRCTIEAVHAAVALGCKVFIGVGSQAEYGRVNGPLRPDTPTFPENGYGMAKLCAGRMSCVEAHALGLEHMWVRLLSAYGPQDGLNSLIPRLISTLLTGECPALTAGEQIWDYIYSDDVAEALWRVGNLGKDGAVYTLGSGQGRPLREYIEIVRDLIDPKLPLRFGDMPYSSGQVMYLKADISALRDDVGFEPQVDFRNGIRKTVEWIKKDLYEL